MVQLAPSAVKPARPILPPRVSLLSSAILVDEKDARWEAGFSYVPEGCGVAGTMVACSSDARTAPNGCIASPAFEPFGIWATDAVSTFNFAWRDYAARATRKLIATESKLIEQQLYSNSLALVNPKIQDAAATTIAGGARAPVAALSALEDELGLCSAGIRMMIHVRPGMVVQWLKNGLIRREGDVYLSPMDNIVVPGRGYTGGSPAGVAPGATEWIYTTPVVEVRRGLIQVFPDDMGQATNTSTNSTVYWAERLVSAVFDPNCCRLAMEVTRSAD